MEQTHKLEGFVGTILVHSGLLALLLFLTLGLPNPPLSETASLGGGGVDLNYGDPLAGTYDLSNLTPTNPDVSTEETTPATEQVASNEPSESDPQEETVTPTEIEDAVEIDAKESKDKKKEEKKTEAKKTTTSEKKDEVKEQKVDTRFVMNKKNSSSNTSSKNAGEDNNTPGNPGNPNGKDEKGKYLRGNPGHGDNPNGTNGTGRIGFLEGYGNWKFEGNPIPNDNSSEEGKLFFDIIVDEDGNIMNVVRTKNLGVSPTVEKLYMNHLKNSKNLKVAAPDGVDIRPGEKIPVVFTISNK